MRKITPHHEPRTRNQALVLLATVLLVLTASARQASAPQVPDRLTALQREAEALARQESTLLGELRRLQVERDLRNEQLQQAETELASLNQQRTAATEQAAQLDQQITLERPAVARRLVEIYKLGPPAYARLLLDVDGLASATRAYRTVTALVEADRQRISRFRATVDHLKQTERELADRTARIETLQAEAKVAKAAASRAMAAHSSLVADIDARRDLNAKMAGELLAAQQKLAALSPVPSAPAAAAVSPVSLARLRGSLDWPAIGRLGSHFGPQRDPRFGTTTVKAGIEITAEGGTLARSVESGVVAYAQPFTGFGNLVIVDHGQQAYSLYGYLDSIAVARGATVSRGQPLGVIGQSPAGKSGLYFELRIDGKPVDPVQWLKKR